jgi:hypothetical protein
VCEYLGLQPPQAALVLAEALVMRARDAHGAAAADVCASLFGGDKGVSAAERLRAFKWLWVACGRFAIRGNVVASNNRAAAEFGEADRRGREPNFVLRRLGSAADAGAVPMGKTCFFAPPAGRKYLNADDFVRELVAAWWANHRVPYRDKTLSHEDMPTAMKNELASSICHLYIIYRAGDFSAESMRRSLDELGLGPDRCVAYGEEGPCDTIFETLCDLVRDTHTETTTTNVQDSRR